jgi:ABC-type polar amino acid transport system ATPase subunit
MISFVNVSKSHGEQRVLDDVSLHVRAGSLHVLCGQSGAGKSTLLATVNGLEPIQSGCIYIDGAPLTTKPKDLRSLRREIGVVFQSYNLFGHMSVEQNVRLALERSLGLDETESKRRTDEQMERLGLADKKDAYPSEISGGEQQRVAIARSMAMKPKILLLDEPLAALDLDNAAMVVDTIRSLKNEGITILLATHQLGVCAPLADEIACMKNGRIIENCTAEELSSKDGEDSQIVAWLEGSRGQGKVDPPLGDAASVS